MLGNTNILSFNIKPRFKVLNINSFDDLEVSEASVKSMLPEGFDAKMNLDIMPVVFNLAVVNQINDNGDAINSLAAIKCVKNFANKPINVEHQRDQIVGHMINATLSEDEFDFSEKDLSSFADKTSPFYINAIGFIYRKIFPQLAEAIIEAADEDSEDYKSISTSWELAAKHFSIVKGNSKNLEDCDYIDASDFDKYKGYLKKFGGKGVDPDGDIVGRVFYGDVYPLGAGLTLSPAANVEGVYPVEMLKDDEKSQKAIAAKQKNSQFNKNDVTTNKSNILNMDEKQFEEFMKRTTEAIASVVKKDSEARSIGQIMQDTLKEHADSWQSKVQLEASAREKAEAALASLEEAKNKMQSELDQIKSDLEAKASAETFNARMSYFDDKYELTEAESAIIASELKALGQEEAAFESVKTKMDILFAHKDKAAIAKQKEDEKARIEALAKKMLAESSASVATTEVVASQETTSETETETEVEIETEATANATIPNSNGNQTQQQTLLEKARASFKVTIS